MSKENFIEKISDEKLIEIVDRALRYEKNRKENNKIAHWLKIIPAAACVVLIIALLNILPMFQHEIDNDINYGSENPNRLLQPIDPNDPYSHVRFGKTRNILLLDVEWHTPETFEKEVVEPYKRHIEEWRASDDYLQSSDEEKSKREKFWKEMLQHYEEQIVDIKNNILLWTRTINGINCKECGLEISYCDKPKYDADGYLIWEVYPYNPGVFYIDENGESQYKSFGKSTLQNQAEYRDVLEKEIIPFCDDLLERGLLTQEDYDYYTTLDPLDYYVDLWFN